MTAGYLIVILLFLGAALYVAAPLMRKDAAEAERVARANSEEQELESQRGMVMAALKDLEDDRAADKVGEADYAGLHAQLTSRAVEIMKRQDQLQARAAKAERAKAIRHPRAKAPGPSA